MKFFHLLSLTFILLLVATKQGVGQSSAVMPSGQTAVFSRYCMDCHDSKTHEGNVDLEKLSFDLGSDIQVAEVWQQVLNAINSGDMPPQGEDQLKTVEKAAFLSHLSTQMVSARAIHADNGGVITLRRLNRGEFANTLDSLLGVRPVLDSLPDDQPGGGFDTNGASLFFSSDQLERYIEIGQRALEDANFPIKTRKQQRRVEAERQHSQAVYQKRLIQYQEPADRARAFQASQGKSYQDFGFMTERSVKGALKDEQLWVPAFENYLRKPQTKNGVMLMSWQKFGLTNIPIHSLTGRAKETTTIRVKAAMYPNVEPRYHYLEFIAKNKKDRATRIIGWRKVTGTPAQPEIIEIEVPAVLGETETYSVRPRSHTPEGKNHNFYFPKVDSPSGVWVDWVEYEKAALDDRPIKEAKDIFFPRPAGWSEQKHAREIIRRFATRAFRIVEPAEEYLDKLLVRYKAKRDEKQSFEAAVIHSLAIVLASPNFLYMVESNGDGPLSGPELAVRLSYFLWSSPPDQQLLAAAQRGDLAHSAKLRQQTSRLLADSRADNFIRSFGHQWLDMERLGMFKFDPVLHPRFDSATMQNSRDEIFATLRHSLDNKLPLKDFLKSDYVVINDVMADYYELKGVGGHEFRKVSLPAESPRGGLLGTAAVLAMGADGTRSSPVERGAWVLRHLLHDPPPPAPANVPQLSEIENQHQPARILQRLHQEAPQCAQCHRKIDPIGYAMESFDAAGRWRDKETIRYGHPKMLQHSKVFPIDTKVKLADGTPIKDFFELRDAVAERNNDFARGTTESLIAYGLGRPYGFTDRELADDLLKRTQANGYTLEALIQALVQSKQFQNK